MLKILIADDEHHVVHHLSTLLAQIDFCVTDILTTCSGPEALQIIASTHIDMAFLDINMPRVNGLQIASRLHAQWPECRILFLTAYEVFDYIYEASQYPGAVYLLKAETDETILHAAASCCRSILMERDEKSFLSAARKKEKLLLLLQEQQFLKELLYENSSSNLNAFAQDAGLDLSLNLDDDCYLMLMYVKRARLSARDYAFYLEKMEQLIGGLFTFSFVEMEKGMLLWIFQEKDMTSDIAPSYFSCLKDMMDSFLEICSHLRQQTVSLYLSSEKAAWSQLSRTYQKLYESCFCDDALMSFHTSCARVTDPHDCLTAGKENACSARKHPALSEPLNLMKQALYQGDRDQFLSSLHLCRQHCTAVKSMHNTDCIRIYFSIVIIFLDYIGHYNLEAQLSLKTALYPLYYLGDFTGWEQAFRYLSGLADLLFEISRKTNHDKTRQLVNSIQNYIQNHLSENLTLTAIADYVNYNESHISRLFKRVSGMNLSEYITGCRIELAKKLLTQTNDTIQAISHKTGFSTSQYFSSTFRKTTGMAPNEYRAGRSVSGTL